MADIGIKLGVEGEKEFKSALADINRELNVSASEVTKLAAKYSSTDKSVAATTERQKALEAQLAKQKEAVKTISEALENAKNSFGEADKRTLEWQKKLNNAEAAVYKTEKAIKDNNSATEEQKKKLEEAKKKLGEYAKAAEEKAAKALKALSAAAAGAVTAVSALVLKAGSAADELSDMSKVTGLTTTQLQKYRYTANMAGTSLETITGAQTKLTKQMAAAKDETSAAAKRFADLGVSVQDASGHLRNSDDVFVDVIDALGRIDNEAERDAAAMDIFGKSAKDLNPLILEGADGLREYAKQAEELGVIVSEDNVAALADMQGKVKEITAQFDALKQNLAAKFAPIAMEVLEKVQKVIQAVAKQLDSPKFKAAIDKLGKALKDFLQKAADAAEKVLPHLVSVATFLISNFDKLAISIGAVWAVMKGVSVVRSLTEAFTTVKTVVASLKTTATNTTAAIEGMNSTMEASSTVSAGWVGVALAAAAAIIATTEAVDSYYKGMKEKAIAPSKELRDEISDLKETLEGSRGSYEESVAGADIAAQKAHDYVARLKELESQSSLTNTEQREYSSLITQLKTTIPDLNVAIDKNTGLLEDGADALDRQIENWQKKIKLEATEATLKTEYENQIRLQNKLTKAREKYYDVSQKYFRYMDIHDKMWGAGITEEEDKEMRRLAYELTGQQYDLFGTTNAVKAVADETTAALQEASGAYAESVAYTDELIGQYEELSGEIEKTTEATKKNGGAFKETSTVIDEHALKVKELTENHYKKLVDAATDIFKKIDETTELSMEKIVDTLKHNRDALLRYEDNMRIIAERGASQAALEYLDSLGVEQAGVIDLIAKSTNKEFDEFLSTFDGNIEEAQKSAVKWGRTIGEGIAGGMKDKEPVVYKAAKNLAHMAEKGFTTTLEINSPSRVFYRDTLNVGHAVELSLRDSAAEVEKASGYLARSLESGFDPSVAAPLAYAPRASRAAVSPAISGSGNVYNYYISDPSPAYMDMIMANVDARFGGLYA